jgi:hypothetical protein
VLKTDIQKPVAISTAVDVYKAMPNSTDVTEYLKLELDVGNFALDGGAKLCLRHVQIGRYRNIAVM